MRAIRLYTIETITPGVQVYLSKEEEKLTSFPYEFFSISQIRWTTQGSQLLKTEDRNSSSFI